MQLQLTYCSQHACMVYPLGMITFLHYSFSLPIMCCADTFFLLLKKYDQIWTELLPSLCSNNRVWSLTYIDIHVFHWFTIILDIYGLLNVYLCIHAIFWLCNLTPVGKLDRFRNLTCFEAVGMLQQFNTLFPRLLKSLDTSSVTLNADVPELDTTAYDWLQTPAKPL